MVKKLHDAFKKAMEEPSYVQALAFCDMLPEYAAKGHGEGFMHDTAMLLGALGWSAYDGQAEIVTPYFGASGTGQLNAVFPVTPQDGRAIPPARASNADGYTSITTRL